MTRLRSENVLAELRALLNGGTLTGLGEGQLVERFLTDGDEAAFAELIARQGPMVLGICRRWLDDPHDVEDAFQATFLILLRKAASLRDRDSLSNWLFGVSVRVARRARANAVRRRTRERPAGPDVAAVTPTSDVPADRETMTIVDQEIRRLPEKQQAAVVDRWCRHPKPGLSLGPQHRGRAGHQCRWLFVAHTIISHCVLSAERV